MKIDKKKIQEKIIEYLIYAGVGAFVLTWFLVAIAPLIGAVTFLYAVIKLI